MRHYGFGRYVSVDKKRAKALKKIEQLKKKNPNIRPVIIEGRTLAASFWAKSWNKNLERYADYENRIGRGRSYVRHRAVLDLRIEKGKTFSLVQGSVGAPYKIEIRIDAVRPGDWKRVTAACLGKIDSLPKLLDGTFPKDLAEIFMEKGSGLFPSPKEIHFGCSCPDSASMCKHVAATLYGIGARIDEDPSLFFFLRGVDIQELITSAIKETTRDLLGKAQSGNRAVVDTEDLSALFGIEMDEGFAPPVEKPKRGRPKAPTGKKGAGSTSTASQKKRAERSPAVKKAAAKSPASAGKIRDVNASGTSNAVKKKFETSSGKISAGSRNEKSPFDTVVGVIRRRTAKGIGVAEIREKTGLTETQIRNAIYRARAKGLIENQARGLFIKGPVASR